MQVFHNYKKKQNKILKDVFFIDPCICPDVHCGKRAVLTLSGKTCDCAAELHVCVFSHAAVLHENRKDKVRETKKKSEWVRKRNCSVWKLSLTPHDLSLLWIWLLTLLSFVPFPSWPPNQRRVASQTQASTCNMMHTFTLYPHTNY